MLVQVLALVLAPIVQQVPSAGSNPGVGCTPGPRVTVRLDEWRAAESAWEARVRELRGAERRALRKQDPVTDFTASFEELAQAGEGRAWLWLARHADRAELGMRARQEREVELWERVIGGSAGCDWLAEAVGEIADRRRVLGAERVRRLLQAVADGPGSVELRSKAGWELARHVEREEGLEAARALYEGLAAEFEGSEVARAVAERLYSLEHLCVGCEAPDFEGRDVDGGAIRLSDHRGKIVLLDFWGLWCKPCVEELPNLAALRERHRDGPFVVLGIDSGDEPDHFRERAPELGVTWPNVLDGTRGPVTEAYRIRVFPTTYVLDARGVIRHVGLRGQELGRAIDALVAELSARR